jgi:hypothetical protein
MGVVIQKFRPRGGGIPAKAFQSWITQIKKGIVETLVPALSTAKMLLPKAKYQKAGIPADFVLAQMGDFNSLIAQSQEYNTPIFNLTDSQIGLTGIVLERTKTSMEQFRRLFSSAADRVLKLSNNA